MEWIFEPFLDVSHIFEQKKRTDVRDVPEGKRGEKKNAFQNGGRCSHISRPRSDGEAKKYKHKRRNEGNEVDEARSSWLDWILPRSSVLFLPRRAKKAKKKERCPKCWRRHNKTNHLGSICGGPRTDSYSSFYSHNRVLRPLSPVQTWMPRPLGGLLHVIAAENMVKPSAIKRR